MSEFKSPKIRVNKSPKYIFEILSDLRNLKKILPKEVADFQANEESCSFKLTGMPELTLRVNEKSPYDKISFKAEDSQIPFLLNCHIYELEKEVSELYLELNIELNMMM